MLFMYVFVLQRFYFEELWVTRLALVAVDLWVHGPVISTVRPSAQLWAGRWRPTTGDSVVYFYTLEALG